MTEITERLAGPTVVRASEVTRGLLIAAGLEHEPTVMLEPAEDGVTIRKLTPVEKLAHMDRTGEPAFLGSDEEMREFWDAIPAVDDPA